MSGPKTLKRWIGYTLSPIKLECTKGLLCDPYLWIKLSDNVLAHYLHFENRVTDCVPFGSPSSIAKGSLSTVKES